MMNSINISLFLLLMASSMTGQKLLVKSTMSAKNDSIKTVQSSQPEPEPEPAPEPEGPTFDYPIEATIGIIPTSGTFDDFTAIQQIAVSAVRTANNTTAIQNQFDDYGVIAAQNPGGLAGNVEMNRAFLQTYATPTMSAAAYESWQAYNNWVLGVQDIRSSWDLNGETIYKTWDGSVPDFRGYKGWHIHIKNSSFNAVNYP